MVKANVVKVNVRERTWKMEGSARSMNAKPRVYVWPKDESILDNLANRRVRPVALYRDAADKALALVGVTYERLRWSQKAGCSCGCSPGFVLEGARRPEGGRFDVNVYVELVNDQGVKMVQAPRGTEKDRLLAVAFDPTMPESFRDEAFDKAFEQLELAL